MKPRIWINTTLRETALARLQATADLLTNADLDTLPGAAAVIINSAVTADGPFMDKAGPALQIIARPGIGVDNVDIPAATARGILVVNTPDAPTESTAEHAVALLLALAKGVVVSDRRLRRDGDWRAAQLLGTEVRGRILGVIGYGRIGRRVAEICRLGLQMRVLVYDPYVVSSLGETAVPGVEIANDLDTLLTQADFITLHTPHTSETHHLIDQRALRLMKPTAYLINASRGPVVDEAALLYALQAEQLAGAGLDVFDPEPPAADNLLLRLANVVVTPHIASATDMGTQAMSDGVVDQVLQVLNGQRPSFLLNPEAWPGRTDR